MAAVVVQSATADNAAATADAAMIKKERRKSIQMERWMNEDDTDFRLLHMPGTAAAKKLKAARDQKEEDIKKLVCKKF